MIGKRLGLAVCFAIIIVIRASAQEIGIGLNAGLQGMHYSLQNGGTKPLPGASLGLDYVFRFDSCWGLLTGIAGGLYRTQASLRDGLVLTYNEIDDAGSAFQYKVRLTGYKETQRLLSVSIPLLLQYHTGSAGTKWYFAGGGKVFFPLNTSIHASARQLSLSGYYPNFDLNVSNLPQHGFGTLDSWQGSVTTQMKPAVALSAATGLSFPISPGARVYAGVYVDYGLTNLRNKSDSLPIVTYSAAGMDKVKANGVLNMQNAGPVKLLCFGVQVRVSFQSAKAKPARTNPAPPMPASPEKPVIQTKPVVETKPSAGSKASSETKPAIKSMPVVKTKPTPASISTSVPKPAPTPIPAPTPKPSAQPKITAVPPAPVMPAISDGEVAVIQRPVVFGIIDETAITEFQKSNLDEVANIMKQHPDLRISIVGQTCDGISETENIKVGEARAKAVARYLQSRGINRRRMDINYSRQKDPDLSIDPATNYQNRRVVISVE
jgi:OmpA-OmpF porin, OOP family